LDRGIVRKDQLLLECYNGKAPWEQFLNEDLEYYGLGAHFYFRPAASPRRSALRLIRRLNLVSC